MATPIVEKPLTAEAAARRAGVAAGLAAGLVALAGGALTLNHMLPGVFYDDGLYVGIAYALSHGLGYAHPHLPGDPAAVHCPPLYPLVLAPFVGLLPLSAAVFAAKVLNIGFGAVAAGLIAWYATRVELLGPGAPGWLPAAIVAGAAVALPTLTSLCVLFSEPLFSVLLALAIILADRPPSRWSPETGATLAGVAAALALLTRTIGVAAGVGIVLHVLVIRRAPWQRAALAGAPVFVAALGWGLWVARHRGGIDPGMATNYGSYFEVLKGAGLGVFWPSLRELPRPLGGLTLPWFATLPADAVIAADFEPLIWLNTGRLSVPFYIYGYRGREVTAPTPAEQRAYLERQGASYVMISGYVSQSVPELNALVRSYPGWLTMVKQWSGGRTVFRVNRGF